MIGRIAALAGAIPTQIEVPDLPTAFATGRVDVMITSASTGVDTKSQDYLSHYIDTQPGCRATSCRQQGGIRQAHAGREEASPMPPRQPRCAAGMSLEEMTIKTPR